MCCNLKKAPSPAAAESSARRISAAWKAICCKSKVAGGWAAFPPPRRITFRTYGTPCIDPEMAAALALLRNNLAEKWTVPALAAACGLSPTAFIRRFSRAFGNTPAALLISLRLREGARLLTESALSVAEIARRCGYQNEFYFSASFRRAYGAPPSAFRRALRT